MIGSCALAVLVCIALAWLAGSGSAPPPAAAAASPPEPPPVASASPVAAAGAKVPLRERADLPEAARRYLDANVYPPTSGRLQAGQLDLLEPNRRWERPRTIPDTLGQEPETTFLLTADHYYYTSDEEAHVELKVERGGRPVAARVLSATAQAEGRGGLLPASERLDFAPEDGELVADLALSRTFADHHGPILLSVRFEWETGKSQDDAIRIFTTPAGRVPAKLTGDFRDSLRGGSLLVEAGIEVFAPGFYRFDANAFDAQGRPVAFASFKGELEKTDRWVPFEFFGKVLRDAGAEGPLTIRHVRGYRFLDGGFPDRERLRDQALVWTTGSYSAAAFSEEPYTSEHQEHMVELMLEDVAAGRSLDLPPLAGGEPGS